jgi:Tannase and feruloyl esterase/Trehalose utilisation
MRNRILVALLLASPSLSAKPAVETTQAVKTSVTFAAKAGPGQGRHVVFLAGDEEYRSEEALPMLAKILSQRHGFRTTVLFSVDPDGTINPNNARSLSSSAALDAADAVVMSLRFRAWPDDDMARFDRFIRSGKPVVALRTSTHAFSGFPKGSPWEAWNYDNQGGFGKRVLGETWLTHWGRHKAEATRGAIEPTNRSHPVLRSVTDIFGETDVYEAYPPADATILVRGIVLQGMTTDSPAASHRKPRSTDKQEQGVNDPPMPIVWTRVYKNASGTTNRILTTTMGSATDLENESLRRLVVNGVYWGLNLDVPVRADVSYVDEYVPSFYGFDGFRRGLRASDFELGNTVPGVPLARPVSAAACADLARRPLPNTTIASAEPFTAGSFTPPGTSSPITGLPPFCRVAGVIAPTSDSQIRFEVWLPLDRWNGKFAGVGNGGWAGTISYPSLIEQLRRGYATASTNTGHEAAPGLNMARFAFDKPEQLIDFAYRAHHETAMQGKALAEGLFGKAPERSYFVGCSSGGYEGLMEAQRFPADYDGIVAGAPANNWTRLMAGDLDATLAMFQDPASLLTPAARGVLHRAALSTCDAADGIADGVLEDPRRCKFDPASLACSPTQDPATCLTRPQIDAARRIYGGLKDPTNGAQLYPGLAPGSEPFWPNRDPANPFAIPISHYRWLVFGDPNWDWKTFKFTDPGGYQAFLKGEEKFASIMNATDSNLRAFRQRGGKLLQYHGWNDQLISPQNSIDYYENVLSLFGSGHPDRAQTITDVQSFYRLFMAPGMAHCGSGTGPNTFDMQTALEQWVERATAPERIIATRSVNGVVDRLRPLCPYPQMAVYNGQGDTNDAANFVCRK